MGKHSKEGRGGAALRIVLLIAAVLGLALLLRSRLAPAKTEPASGENEPQVTAAPAAETKKPWIFS